MPERVLRKVWAYFDALGPLTGGIEWPITYRQEEAERAALLRAFGVRAFTAMLYPHKPGMARWLNDWAAGFARRTPDCLHTSTLFPEPGAAAYVREAVEQGARVFKAHVQVGAYDPSDEALDACWGLLAEAGVPVVVHCGSGPAPGKHTGPEPVARVLARHPRLRLVVAHMGMPEYEDFLDLAERYREVRLDTTMAFTGFSERMAPFPGARCPGWPPSATASCSAPTSQHPVPVRPSARCPRGARAGRRLAAGGVPRQRGPAVRTAGRTGARRLRHETTDDESHTLHAHPVDFSGKTQTDERVLSEDVPIVSGMTTISPQRRTELLRPDGSSVRVLVVDDEQSITELLSMALRYEGWQIRSAADGQGALRAAREFRPDAVVLDMMLPDMDGLSVLGLLRRELPDVPVLFLTAKDAVEDRIAGLTAGGDDYVTKPFSLEEVVARLRGLIRRSYASDRRSDALLVVGDLTLDEESHEVTRGGTSIHLTATEFELLRFLMRNPRRVLSKAQILDRVWSYDFGGQANVVELYISYLRRKIDAGREPMIHTRRGAGYLLKPAVS